MVKLNASDSPTLPSHDCNGPVRLLVEGPRGKTIGIPVIDDGLTVHYRKDGPLDVSTRVEVDIPLEGLGEEWYQYIDAFSEEGGFQEAAVGLKKGKLDGDFEDGYYNVARGYIGGVGGAGDNVGHLTIFGPYKFLNQLAAAHTFDKGAPVLSAVEWLINELNSRQNLIDNITLSNRTFFDAEAAEQDFSGARGEGIELPTEGPELKKSETFTSNRHTLADVASFIQNNTDIRLFFQPTPDGGVSLVVSQSPGTLYDATSTDTIPELALESIGADIPELTLIENNALYEMNPINTVRAKGKNTTLVSVDGVNSESGSAQPGPGGATGSGGSGELGFAVVEAYYPPLVDRAGGRIATTIESKNKVLSIVEKEARNILKTKLDNVSGGTMTMPITPSIFPFDRVLARPSCASVVSTDLPMLSYEVQRVAHNIMPSGGDQNNLSHTEIAVSMAVIPDLIKVDSKVKSATPAAGAENEPDPTPTWDPKMDT